VHIAIRKMQEGKRFRLAEALPNRFDLRSFDGKSFISRIRNQTNCGSCVAFGVAAALESRWAVQNTGTLLPFGEEIDLSKAHLFYCYGKTAGRNCENGWACIGDPDPVGMKVYAPSGEETFDDIQTTEEAEAGADRREPA